MESWLPLMDIFMNSPCPETEASLWLQSSFHPSSNPSISISTASFISLLMQSTEAVVVDSSSSSSSSIPAKQRFMWLQTLPDAIQARILSFLTYEHAKFNKRDLSKLAQDMLFNGTEVDFWVRRAAHQLLDVVSDPNYKWVSCLNLDSEEEKLEGNFGGMPRWLKDVASANDSVLPWLPISVDELNTRMPHVACEDDEDLMVEVDESEDGNFERVGTQGKLVHREIDPVDHETVAMAACLKARVLNLESSLKAVELVDDIRKLCVKWKGDSLTVLGLIELWNADEEVVPILLSRLVDGNEDDFAWTCNILCSIVLPKLLILEKPAPRVLVTATIDYCKVHHKAAVYALLFPLILHKDGINNPICDVITRIIRECLHPAQVSAFCQKLLCEEDENKYICVPCHRHLVSRELVWTEPLFNLFQNILNHNVHLTQDSVDQLVSRTQESATMFSKSLKFANFLLYFVGRFQNWFLCWKISVTIDHLHRFKSRAFVCKLGGGIKFQVILKGVVIGVRQFRSWRNDSFSSRIIESGNRQPASILIGHDSVNSTLIISVTQYFHLITCVNEDGIVL